MAKGSGSTRQGNSSSPRGIGNSSQTAARAMEEGLKRSLADDRERVIENLKETRRTGEVGKLVNEEIDRAINNTEEALKKMESVNNIAEINEADSYLGNRLRSIVARLSIEADRHEWNSNYATGRRIRTLNNAADALRQTAYEITQIVDNRYGSDSLSQMFEVFRSQNRWK